MSDENKKKVLLEIEDICAPSLITKGERGDAGATIVTVAAEENSKNQTFQLIFIQDDGNKIYTNPLPFFKSYKGDKGVGIASIDAEKSDDGKSVYFLGKFDNGEKFTTASIALPVPAAVIADNDTLVGNGTAEAPLKVAFPFEENDYNGMEEALELAVDARSDADEAMVLVRERLNNDLSRSDGKSFDCPDGFVPTTENGQIKLKPIKVPTSTVDQVARDAADAAQIKANGADLTAENALGTADSAKSEAQDNKKEIAELKLFASRKKVKELSQLNGTNSPQCRVYLMADGSLKANGTGYRSSNGDVKGENVSLPADVVPKANNVKFTRVFSGTYQHCAIDEDGFPWMWGDNSFGVLSLNMQSNFYQTIPHRVPFFYDNKIKIKKVVFTKYNTGYGGQSVFFLTTKGELYACGRNTFGELGDGSYVDKIQPVRCGTVKNITDVFVSGYRTFVYAIDADKRLWVWGDNQNGQLGLGDTFNKNYPTLHPIMTNIVDAAVCSGGNNGNGYLRSTGFVVDADGNLFGAGDTSTGELATGDSSDRRSFVKINIPNEKIVKIYCGEGSGKTVVALSDKKEAWGWGFNYCGELGLKNWAVVRTPTRLVGDFQGKIDRLLIGGFNEDQSTFIQAGNSLYAAGKSTYGELGICFFGERRQFDEVLNLKGTIKDWNFIGGQYHERGLTVLLEDGTVLTCGQTRDGALGWQVNNLHNSSILKSVIF